VEERKKDLGSSLDHQHFTQAFQVSCKRSMNDCYISTAGTRARKMPFHLCTTLRLDSLFEQSRSHGLKTMVRGWAEAYTPLGCDIDRFAQGKPYGKARSRTACFGKLPTAQASLRGCRIKKRLENVQVTSVMPRKVPTAKLGDRSPSLSFFLLFASERISRYTFSQSTRLSYIFSS